jgi:hypothetical protein
VCLAKHLEKRETGTVADLIDVKKKKKKKVRVFCMKKWKKKIVL